MTPAARTQAAIELLDEIIVAAREGGRPADAVLAEGWKRRRYAGSKDRRAIADLVYRAIRRFGDPPATARSAFVALADEDAPFSATFDGSSYGPEPIASGEARAGGAATPAWLQDRFDDDQAAALLARAPLDLRINTLKATREQVQSVMPDARPVGDLGLRLDEASNVHASQPYRDGWVEVQDLGSQFVAQACRARPGGLVVDLCAGGGGKTLALAAAMGNEGRLIACDTSRDRLAALTPRAARAGARVETRLLDGNREREGLRDLVGQADVVLVDAPCSGTGTWRRNPEARWRLTPERLDRLVALQGHILAFALPLVQPGGALVYAVCSLLEEEGRRQIERVTSAGEGWQADILPFGTFAGPGVILSPWHDETDGFFVARLVRGC